MSNIQWPAPGSNKPIEQPSKDSTGSTSGRKADTTRAAQDALSKGVDARKLKRADGVLDLQTLRKDAKETLGETSAAKGASTSSNKPARAHLDQIPPGLSNFVPDPTTAAKSTGSTDRYNRLQAKLDSSTQATNTAQTGPSASSSKGPARTLHPSPMSAVSSSQQVLEEAIAKRGNVNKERDQTAKKVMNTS